MPVRYMMGVKEKKRRTERNKQALKKQDMKDIKIVSGEPFRTKVIRYSYSKINKVVIRNMNLYKVNDNVYLSEFEKDEFRWEDDRFVFVLKVKDLFVESDIMSRRWIEDHPEAAEIANKAALTYVEHIEGLVKDKKHIPLLFISVYEELGLDTKSLWDVRAERELLKKEKEQKEAEEKKQKQLEAEIKEKDRLEQVKQQFLNGEFINVEDFLVLCKNDGVDIHIRTKGTFYKNVDTLNISGSIYYNKQKGKNPSFSGCFKAIAQYKIFLTQNK
jgi:hypothetical protein